MTLEQRDAYLVQMEEMHKINSFGRHGLKIVFEDAVHDTDEKGNLIKVSDCKFRKFRKITNHWKNGNV